MPPHSRGFHLASPSLRVFLQLSALAVFLIVIRLPVLLANQPIDDEVVYAVVGNEMAAGGDIYVGAVERKPPLLLEIYAWISAAFGPGNAFALHAVATAWIALTMIAVYLIAAHLFSAEAGFSAALCYAVFQQWFYWNNLAFNGEVLMNLPIALAILIVLRGGSWPNLRWWTAGALLAVAFLLKQPAGIATVPFVMFSVSRRRNAAATDRMLATGWLLFGWLTIIAATALWLDARGLLGEAWYWTIADHDVPYFHWRNLVGKSVAFAMLCAPLIAGAWWSARNAALWRGDQGARTLLLMLVVVSAIGASASWRFYAHYYTALVLPLCILAAPAIAARWRLSPASRRVVCAWLAATVVVFAVSQTSGLSRLPSTTEAGAYLQEVSRVGDRIFVWGRGTRIYLDARRRPATRYIATFPLTGRIFGPPLHRDTSDRILPAAWPNLQADFASHPPAFIVDLEVGANAEYPAERFPILRDLLRDEYVLDTRTSEGLVYRRRLTSVAVSE